jgi:hypothetical protein
MTSMSAPTKLFLGGLLTLSCMVAVAIPAHASDLSGQFANAGFYKLVTNNTTFTVGGVSVSCTNSTIKSNAILAMATIGTATAPGNVGFTGCKVPLAAVTVTIATSGTWSITGEDKLNPNPTESWNVLVSIAGMQATVPSTTCTVKIDAQSILAEFTDTSTSLDIAAASLKYTSDGVGMGCPTKGSGTGTITAQYTVTANTTFDSSGNSVVVDLV